MEKKKEYYLDFWGNQKLLRVIPRCSICKRPVATEGYEKDLKVCPECGHVFKIEIGA